MASATEKISFTCPECAKVLRLSSRPAEGKKIKCSGCGNIFKPEVDDDATTTIQDQPRLKTKGKGSSKGDPDERPSKKRSRDYDDEDDDRPRKGKKKTKEESGNRMLVIGGIAAIAVMLVFGTGLLAMGAFVWPGFLRSKPADKQAEARNDKATKADDKGNEDGGNKNPGVQKYYSLLAGNVNLANYVPSDADVVLGIDVKTLRATNQLETMLQQVQASQKGSDLPPDVMNLIRNCDNVVMSLQIPARAFQPAQQFPGQFGGGQPGQFGGGQFAGGPPNQFGGGAPPQPGFGGGQPGFGGGAPPQPGFGGGQPGFGGGAPPQPGFGGGQPGFGGGAPPQPGFGGGQPAPGVGGGAPPQPGFGGGQPGQFGGKQPAQFAGGQPGFGGGQPGFGGGQPFQPIQQDPPKIVVVVLASNADAINRIKSMPEVGPERQVGKYKVNKLGKTKADDGSFIAFPSDRMLVLGSLKDQELIALFDQAAKNQGSPSEAVRLAVGLEKSYMYATLKFNDQIRNLFKDLDKAAEKVPQIGQLKEPLMRANGASFAVDMLDGGANWKVRLNVDCANAKDAAEICKGAAPIKDMIQLVVPLGIQGAFGIEPPKSLTRDLNSLTLDSQGTVATMSLSISKETVDELNKLAETLKKGGAGGGGFGGQKGAPKVDEPKKGPGGDPPFNEKKGIVVNEKVPYIYTLASIASKGATSKNDKTLFFDKGQRVNVEVFNNTANPQNKVDTIVFNGKDGQIVGSELNAKDRQTRIEFVAPDTGNYTLRVANRGPGAASQVIVTVTRK